MIIGNPQQKVFYFKRFAGMTSVTASADGTDTFQNYQFRLADVPGFTEFTTLFDFYKIKAIKIKFLPQFTQYSASLLAANTLPGSMRIFSILDYNSISSPTIDAMRQYQNCKITQYTRGHTRYFKPRLNLDTEGSGEAQFGKQPWINTDQSAVQYLGLRVAVDTNLYPAASIASGDILLRAEATFYLAFKSPR